MDADVLYNNITGKESKKDLLSFHCLEVLRQYMVFKRGALKKSPHQEYVFLMRADFN